MEMPEFPQGFVKNHCSKVLEARYWRKYHNQPPDPEDDEANAECGFVVRGFGLECENCRKFICPLPPKGEADEYYAAIKKYYDDMDKYEKYTKTDEYKEIQRRKEAEATAQRNIGAFI